MSHYELNLDQLEKIRKKHHESETWVDPADGIGACSHCGQKWPCDTAKLLHDLDESNKACNWWIARAGDYMVRNSRLYQALHAEVHAVTEDEEYRAYTQSVKVLKDGTNSEKAYTQAVKVLKDGTNSEKESVKYGT